MAMQRPTLAAIRDRVMADIETNIDQKVPLLRKAILRVLGYVFAGLAHMLYGYIDSIVIDLFPDTCRGAYLDRWASIWSITRKPAAYAVGKITITGIDGTTIPAETDIISNTQIQYKTRAAVTIQSGSAVVTIESETPGIAGNADPLITMSLVNPISGVDSTVTVDGDGVSGGTDTETDESLRERLLLRIKEPPQGGAATDYKQWALEVPGITRTWIAPLYQGAGTVGVAVVTDDDPGGIIPSPAKIQEVFDYIETKRPIGASVIVYAPTETLIPMTIQVFPDTEAVRAAVTAELKELFAKNGGPGGTIYLSEINATISGAAGEQHHALISPTDDLEAGPDGILSVGTITWQS